MRHLTLSIFLLIITILGSGCSDQQTNSVDHSAGIEIYTKNCKVCHASGINGAPILGNNKMWGPRSTQPIETLVEHASSGFGLMPAKGGNDSLTDQQLEQAISYMLSALQE